MRRALKHGAIGWTIPQGAVGLASRWSASWAVKRIRWVVGGALRGIVVKQGLHLSCEFPQSREKLQEVQVEMCPGGSLPGQEALCQVEELLRVEVQVVGGGVGHGGSRGGQGVGGAYDEMVLWRVL